MGICVNALLNVYTQRHLSEILYQTKIRLYLPFSDWFSTKRTSAWIQINRNLVNTIWFRVDWIRFRKYFSVCVVLKSLRIRTKFRRKKTCFCWIRVIDSGFLYRTERNFKPELDFWLVQNQKRNFQYNRIHTKMNNKNT